MPRISAARIAQTTLIAAAVALAAAAIRLGYQHSQRTLPPPPPGGFAYVANAADNSLWIFRYDATSGWLDFTSRTADTGRFPAALASHGHLLYGANAFGASLSGWRTTADSGQVTPLPGSPWPAGKGIASLALDPAGRYLYAGNSGADSLDAWRIGADGSLSPLPGSPYAGYQSPAGLLLAGGWLYVAETGANRISRHALAADGSPGPASASTPAGAAPGALASDSAHHYLLVCNSGANSLGVWRIGADGDLSPLPGSPYGTGKHPASVVVADRFVYVANEESNTLSSWRLDDSGLHALAGAPVSTGKGPHTISLSPDGHYLYTSNSSDKTLSGYHIDPASGQLTELPDSPFATGYGPADVGFVP